MTADGDGDGVGSVALQPGATSIIAPPATKHTLSGSVTFVLGPAHAAVPNMDSDAAHDGGFDPVERHDQPMSDAAPPLPSGGRGTQRFVSGTATAVAAPVRPPSQSADEL